MEEYARLSEDDLRCVLEEGRARFAEKQKAQLEARSKINRGKLSNVSSVTEKTLNVFLRSCCEETEKEQVYVSNVIERVRSTANHTRNNLEKVNQHAQKLLENVGSDVAELSDNLHRVNSGHVALSLILERRESRGDGLKTRRDDVQRSSAFQFDRAGKIFNKIEARIDSQIAQLESAVVELTSLSAVVDAELFTLEQETKQGESAMIVYQGDEQSVQDQYGKIKDEYDQLQTQLTNRNKAKECAESDQANIEMEVTELRGTTQELNMLVSAKISTIEDNESQISKLSVSVAEMNELLLAKEAELQQLEQSLIDQQEAAKMASDEVVQSLEQEVEVVCNRLSEDTIRADVMDKMFGSDIEFTPEIWRASIENAKSMGLSNNGVTERREALLLELETAKSELEKVRQEATSDLADHNMAQSRMRNLKRRIQEDDETEETNLKMIESRITASMKELEDLTNAKCSEANDAFVTPNPARHSSLQNLRKASVEASRGLSDDSDVESVKKSVIDLPDGIVKRNAATQQCSTARSPDASNQSLGDLAAIGGTSTETPAATNAGGNADADVTMEGIPLSASIDHAYQDDKVEDWIRTTPDNVSPGSGTTAEMMDDRFPKNIFNETNKLNQTDVTLDMEDDDLNLSMMEMPAATANKTLSPPPVRQSSSKAGIFVNDSDSDANASVWDDDF